MKILNIFLPLLIVTILSISCDEKYRNGEFDVDESLMPKNRTDRPNFPSVVTASYDEYCDKIVISWMPAIRASAYDLYKNEQIIAQGLTDTFYIDTDADTIDTEYAVYSKNPNGDSEIATTDVGRMAVIPNTPSHFEASDGEFESRVDLSWEAVNFAHSYVLKRGDVILSDTITGNTFSDNSEAPTEPTNYTLIAVSACGESNATTTTGYCDPLVAFSKPLEVNFEGFVVGTLKTADTFEGFIPRFNFGNAPNAHGVVEIKGDNTKYLNVQLLGDKSSIQLLLPEMELLVGQSYTLSFDIKSASTVSLHMGTDQTGNNFMGQFTDNYFLPVEKSVDNDNALGVLLEGTDEWKSYSFDFPQTGTATSDLDADPEALGWSLGTIQDGEQFPIIQINMWAKNGSYAIDNVKVEMIK